MEREVWKKQADRIHRHTYSVPIMKISKPIKPTRKPKSGSKSTAKYVAAPTHLTKHHIGHDKIILPVIKNNRNLLQVKSKVAAPCPKHHLMAKCKKTIKINQKILRKDNNSV